MRHEPELLVPISEVQARSVRSGPSPAKVAFARLWIVVGAVTLIPVLLLTLAGPERGAMKMLLTVIIVVWLAVAWIAGLLSPKDEQR